MKHTGTLFLVMAYSLHGASGDKSKLNIQSKLHKNILISLAERAPDASENDDEYYDTVLHEFQYRDRTDRKNTVIVAAISTFLSGYSYSFLGLMNQMAVHCQHQLYAGESLDASTVICHFLQSADASMADPRTQLAALKPPAHVNAYAILVAQNERLSLLTRVRMPTEVNYVPFDPRVQEITPKKTVQEIRLSQDASKKSRSRTAHPC